MATDNNDSPLYIPGSNYQASAPWNIGRALYVLGFAIHSPLPNVPKQVKAAEIERRFTRARGWNILVLQAVEFQTALPAPRNTVPAVLACVEKMGLVRGNGL